MNTNLKCYVEPGHLRIFPLFICSFYTMFIFFVFQVRGKCGSVTVRLIPAPRGTGIVSAPVPKKLLHMAGIEDCYTSARGCTATLGNFGKFEYFDSSYTHIPR